MPAARPPSSGSPAPSRSATPDRRSPRARRVLVVENDPEARRRLAHALRTWGHDVDEVDTGAAALERDYRRYDLITLELILPIINGKTVIETLAHVGAATPIIVITGAYSPTLRQELAPHPNIRGWFEKPLDFSALKEHVNKLFHGERSRLDQQHPTDTALGTVTGSAEFTNSRLLNRSGRARAKGATEGAVLSRTSVLGQLRVRPRDGMVMLHIPDAAITIGLVEGRRTEAGEPIEAGPGESPAVEVVLSPYYVDKYPVTNSMYQKFLDWQRGAARRDRHRYCHADESANKDHTPAYWNEILWTKASLPVVGVDWWDAYAYSRWALDVTAPDELCLPTEAQWEAAARGADGRLYPWGDIEPDPSLANFTRKIGRTTSVGKYRLGRSACGCLDMAGNVWEWCADTFDELFHKRIATGHAPREDPCCQVESFYRALRGGSWLNPVQELRSSFRGSAAPETRYYHVGFRCSGSAWLVEQRVAPLDPNKAAAKGDPSSPRILGDTH